MTKAQKQQIINDFLSAKLLGDCPDSEDPSFSEWTHECGLEIYISDDPDYIYWQIYYKGDFRIEEHTSLKEQFKEDIAENLRYIMHAKN